LHVPGPGAGAVRVEYELVGREEQSAHGATDALGPRRVVPGRQERAAAAPRALVVHREREVVGQPGRRVVAQERVAQPLGLAPGDHAAPARRHRHGARPAQHLQLHRRALHARDAQRHAPVVDLVVAEPVQQRVADLGQAQPLLVVHLQRDDRHPVQDHRAHLVGQTKQNLLRCFARIRAAPRHAVIV